MKNIKYSEAISLCMSLLDYLITYNCFYFTNSEGNSDLVGYHITIQKGGFVVVIRDYGKKCLVARSKYVPTHFVLNRLMVEEKNWGLDKLRTIGEKSQALELVESKTSDLNKFIASGTINPIDFFNKSELEKLRRHDYVLYARCVECYSKVKEELILSTRDLLLDNGTYKDADTLVDFDMFINMVLEHNSESFSDREVSGTYDSFDKNPYKSRLGLDGLTR